MAATFFTPQATLHRVILGRVVLGDPSNADFRSAQPAAGPTPAVWSIAASAASDETLYELQVDAPSLGIDDHVFSVTTDADATPAELEQGLVDAWNGDDILSGLGTAAIVSGDGQLALLDTVTDLVVTKRTDAGSHLTVSNDTPYAPQSSWKFARFYELTPPTFEGGVVTPGLRAPTDESGPTLTLTIGHAASETYSIDILHVDADGIENVETVEWDAGAAAGDTDDNAETALTDAFPGLTVANASTGTVTLTAAPGERIDMLAPTASGSATLSASVTNATSQATLGLVLDPENESPTTIGGTVTAVSGGRMVPLLIDGGGKEIWVGVEDPGEPVTYGDPVFIETAGSTNEGRPYASAGTNRRESKHWFWVRRDTATGLAVIGTK
jgi:hypothetical protein